MSAVAEKAAEVTAEVVEESVDGVVEVMEVARNNPVTLAVVGVLCLAAGGAGGYFIAKKTLRKYYEDLSAQEIAEAKEFYASLNKVSVDGEPLTPMQVLANTQGVDVAAEALRTYQGRQAAEKIVESGELQTDDEMDEAQIRKIENARIHSVSVDAEPGLAGGKIEVVEKVETRNVFVDPTFDLEEEMKYRTPTTPYIIHHDEYFENEREFENVSLTYYEQDDTLTNESDEPIREIDKMIGEDHLVRFGHGSKSSNVVYVRNERLQTDFEITKSTGSYLEEVLGVTNDDAEQSLDPAARDARRAFRHGDG